MFSDWLFSSCSKTGSSSIQNQSLNDTGFHVTCTIDGVKKTFGYYSYGRYSESADVSMFIVAYADSTVSSEQIGPGVNKIANQPGTIPPGSYSDSNPVWANYMDFTEGGNHVYQTGIA